MVDRQILEKYGLTQDNLKQWLSMDPLAMPGKMPGAPVEEQRRAALVERIRSRIQEGMSRNFAQFRLYHALDLAWDSNFRQVTPTILSQFLDSDPNDEQIVKQIEDWGYTQYIEQKTDPKTGAVVPGKKVFNLPMFFKVIVPLVQSYGKIRWAKIMNDRRQTPFLKYDAVKMTTPLRAKCEALTDRVEVISEQYGYYDTAKQGVFQMLHYGQAVQFPMEEWHTEEQRKLADPVDVAMGKKDADGKVVEEGTEIKYNTREGIRYALPHPTRTYYDIAHPPATINHDSGCMFGGYWSIMRFRELYDNPDYWNRDKITFGANDIRANNQLFFQTVYTACSLAIPTPQMATQPDGARGAATFGTGVGELDREKALANQYYGTDKMDSGCLATIHFEKLIPKDNGLGDYDCPIWMRFVVAGDGATILYAAPVPYNPMLYYGYDGDQNRLRNGSLTLEIIPFQDQFSNLLSQILLTARQNLANLTLVDSDQIDDKTKSWIQNMGETLFRKLNIGTFSSRAAARGQQRIADAIQTFNLPKGNTAELINVLKTILDVLERVLVMSSHEVAQSASHEQTREEVRNIAQSTSTRLEFTATPVDIVFSAWKRQIYQGLMYYGDDDFYAKIPSDIALDKKQLDAMGFTYVDKDEELPRDQSNRVLDQHRLVKTSKKATAMDMWTFASNRDDSNRGSDAQIAQAMATFMRDLLNNQITAQAVGADQAIAAANAIAQLAGLPRDFKLRNAAPEVDPQQQQAQAQQQLQQVIQTVLGQVKQEIAQEMDPLLQATKQNTDDINLIRRALAGAPPTNGAPEDYVQSNGSPTRA